MWRMINSQEQRLWFLKHWSYFSVSLRSVRLSRCLHLLLAAGRDDISSSVGTKTLWHLVIHTSHFRTIRSSDNLFILFSPGPTGISNEQIRGAAAAGLKLRRQGKLVWTCRVETVDLLDKGCWRWSWGTGGGRGRTSDKISGLSDIMKVDMRVSEVRVRWSAVDHHMGCKQRTWMLLLVVQTGDFLSVCRYYGLNWPLTHVEESYENIIFVLF